MTMCPPIDLDARLAVNPVMVLREEGDDCALLFDPDSGRVHVLNPTAVAVWKRFNGRGSLRDITATLTDEFDGMGPEAEAQVLALARALADLGAVGFSTDRS
jgi:hypothetical protein